MTQLLYLVRHGQTTLNAEGRLRGLANPPLDAVGLQEAAALARALAPLGPRRVLTSPLQRAVQTGRAIADAAAIPCSADPRFNDRDYGPWTGHLKAEVVAEWGSVDDAPGVEPVAQVLARVLPALDTLLDVTDDRPIIVVTHDAVIRPLVHAIDAGRGDLVAANGSWNELVQSDDGWTVRATDRLP